MNAKENRRFCDEHAEQATIYVIAYKIIEKIHCFELCYLRGYSVLMQSRTFIFWHGLLIHKNGTKSAWFESVSSTFQTNVIVMCDIRYQWRHQVFTHLLKTFSAVTNISLFIHSSRLFLPGTLVRVCGENSFQREPRNRLLYSLLFHRGKKWPWFCMVI